MNIFTKGESFERHQDKQSLTILVALPEPESFQGGGTAFFLPSDESHDADRLAYVKPSFILTPPQGSVIIFGGAVNHAGCPVLSGERGVFVASMSLAAGAKTPLASLGQAGLHSMP